MSKSLYHPSTTLKQLCNSSESFWWNQHPIMHKEYMIWISALLYWLKVNVDDPRNREKWCPSLYLIEFPGIQFSLEKHRTWKPLCQKQNSASWIWSCNLRILTNSYQHLLALQKLVPILRVSTPLFPLGRCNLRFAVKTNYFNITAFENGRGSRNWTHIFCFGDRNNRPLYDSPNKNLAPQFLTQLIKKRRLRRGAILTTIEE